MFKKLLSFIIIFLGVVTFVQAESSWIKKKDKSENVEKIEKNKSSWIKKKIKENKKEYKKEEKKITKEVKSWIKKKSKDKYISSIKDLPKNAIYFQASNDLRTSLIYGYVVPDKDSKMIKGYYETSIGFGYFNDGKTTCKIGSTIIDVSLGEVTSRISGECTNGLKFTGKTTQEGNSGWGSVKTSDGKEKFSFDFDIQKTEIAKLYERNNTQKLAAHTIEPDNPKTIDLKPAGKYYALLIGNSKYTKWASLTSPVNDINEIGKILENKYKFEKVIKVKNANRKDIFTKLKELSNITTDNDYVLIYYSGHGDEEGTQRYWIPINGEKEYGFGDWINISDIQVYIQRKISNRHLVMMSDSCYFAMDTKGNKIVKDKKSLSYQKLLNRRAVMIVGSGSNEPVVDASQDKHSMFGMSFIQSLKNNQNVIRMRDIVDNIILAHSGMQQQPYGIGIGAWGHSGGDFLFISKNQ